MKRQAVSVGQAVEVQFIPDGPWYGGVVVANDVTRVKGVAVKGDGTCTDGTRGFYTTANIASKWVRPSTKVDG